MIYVLAFTSMIGVSAGFHSVIISSWVFIVCIVILWWMNIWIKKKDITSPWVSETNIWKYILSLVCVLVWWVSVVILYDWRLGKTEWTQHSEDIFVVKEQQRENRYLIVDSSKKQEILLYSTMRLRPWNVIQTNRTIKQRNYDSNRCWRVCTKYRQDGQVVDNGWFNYDGWLYMHNWNWSLYDDHPFVVWTGSLTMRERLKLHMADHFSSIFGENQIGWLWLGMLIGDISWLTKNEYQDFIDSGLVHLVAVSGWNIAIMLALAGLFLFWIPFYPRVVLLMVVVIFYVYLVGGDSSIVRASIMALLTLLALLPGRELSIWRSISYAWVVMLVRNPYFLLYDLWFILSFGALLGIIWADKVLYHRLTLSWKYLSTLLLHQPLHNKKKKTFWQYLMLWIVQSLRIIFLPSIWAMIGVLPILLRNMGQINILSPLANIIVVPFVPLITRWLVLMSFVSRAPLSNILSFALGVIIDISSFTSTHGLMLMSGTVGAGIVGLVMVWYWLWRIQQEVYSKHQ